MRCLLNSFSSLIFTSCGDVLFNSCCNANAYVPSVHGVMTCLYNISVATYDPIFTCNHINPHIWPHLRIRDGKWCWWIIIVIFTRRCTFFARFILLVIHRRKENREWCLTVLGHYKTIIFEYCFYTLERLYKPHGLWIKLLNWAKLSAYSLSSC